MWNNLYSIHLIQIPDKKTLQLTIFDMLTLITIQEYTISQQILREIIIINVAYYGLC